MLVIVKDLEKTRKFHSASVATFSVFSAEILLCFRGGVVRRRWRTDEQREVRRSCTRHTKKGRKEEPKEKLRSFFFTFRQHTALNSVCRNVSRASLPPPTPSRPLVSTARSNKRDAECVSSAVSEEASAAHLEFRKVDRA